MSAHVLLVLLILLVGEKIRCSAILSVFHNKFNKFNNIGTQMQDYVYHMPLKSHFISDFCAKTQDFCILWKSTHNVMK